MDFKWVVDALRHGIRVTRKAWAGDPPMYLYMVTEKKPDGEHIIKMHTGTGQDFEWTPTAEQMLTVDDWEEYVEPKKKPAYITELPFIMTEQDSHGGKPVKDIPDEEHQKELLDTLVNAFAELVSQRVAQFLQKADIPLSKGDTNHV